MQTQSSNMRSITVIGTNKNTMKNLRLFSLLLFCLLAVTAVFGQEVQPEVKKSIFSLPFDWATIFNIAMGILGVIGGGAMVAWKKTKIYARKAGKFLLAFADAVDDDNINANDKTDLSSATRELIAKNDPVLSQATEKLVTKDKAP